MEFEAQDTKADIVAKIKQQLADQGFNLIDTDENKPWGAYFSIDEEQADKFMGLYYPHLERTSLLYPDQLRPKILLIAPGRRLSWQYHSRRAETWRAVAGTFAVASSPTDTEGERQILKPGDTIFFEQGMRHRGIGLDEWGVVAEIWQHTSPGNPSDEADIVRLQDDFNR